MTFGQNVKRLRLKMGLSLQKLADLCNVSFSMLSKIEREKQNPTVNVAIRIACALKTPLSELVGEGVEPDVVIVRKNQRKFYVDEDSGIRIEPTSPTIPQNNIDILMLDLAAKGTAHALPPRADNVKEYIFIRTGAVKLVIGEAEYHLYEGDYIFHEPNKPHQLVNLNDDVSTIFLIIDRSDQNK